MHRVILITIFFSCFFYNINSNAQNTFVRFLEDTIIRPQLYQIRENGDSILVLGNYWHHHDSANYIVFDRVSLGMYMFDKYNPQNAFAIRHFYIDSAWSTSILNAPTILKENNRLNVCGNTNVLDSQDTTYGGNWHSFVYTLNLPSLDSITFKYINPIPNCFPKFQKKINNKVLVGFQNRIGGYALDVAPHFNLALYDTLYT